MAKKVRNRNSKEMKGSTRSKGELIYIFKIDVIIIMIKVVKIRNIVGLIK